MNRVRPVFSFPLSLAPQTFPHQVAGRQGRSSHQVGTKYGALAEPTTEGSKVPLRGRSGLS
jgi:hypothetical protein